MQCDVCQKAEATVFLTHLVSGKMHKVNLCQSCAKSKGLNDATAYQFADELIALGQQKSIETERGALKCPVCGFTAIDLKKTARLGCSNCYEIFETALGPMLKSMHKGTSHTGRAPARLAGRRRNSEMLEALQESLRTAVDKEEYERAATIRDQIRLIESAMGA